VYSILAALFVCANPNGATCAIKIGAIAAARTPSACNTLSYKKKRGSRQYTVRYVVCDKNAENMHQRDGVVPRRYHSVLAGWSNLTTGFFCPSKKPTRTRIPIMFIKSLISRSLCVWEDTCSTTSYINSLKPVDDDWMGTRKTVIYRWPGPLKVAKWPRKEKTKGNKTQSISHQTLRVTSARDTNVPLIFFPDRYMMRVYNHKQADILEKKKPRKPLIDAVMLVGQGRSKY
jgi:hypothetical protein